MVGIGSCSYLFRVALVEESWIVAVIAAVSFSPWLVFAGWQLAVARTNQRNYARRLRELDEMARTVPLDYDG